VCVPLSGCLFRTHEVKREIHGDVPLQAATRDQLVEQINSLASKIQTYNATVDIATTVGGEKKGKITEFQEVRGYVLVKKPAMLRMIGLFPIVRNRAFDMVSDGKQFKVWIPPKNRFVVGQNDVVTTNPQQPLENLRPQIIYDALLLREINPEVETPFLEDSKETLVGDKGHKYQQPAYEIGVIRGQGMDSWLSRKIVFNRQSLLPDRHLIYDQAGNLVTDAKYSDYKDYNGVSFPSKIEITRPQEEYDITLNVVKMDMNKPLNDRTFVLEQPPGVQVIHLDHNTTPSNGGGTR